MHSLSSNLLEYAHYFALFCYFLEYLLWSTGNLCTIFPFSGAPLKKQELRLFELACWIQPLMLVKLFQRQRLLAKVNILKTCILFSNQAKLYISGFSNTPITFNVLDLFLDADRQPADSLSKVAAIDIESLLTKTLDISKGTIYNIWQTLLKEWGSESLGVLPENTIQELLTGVI